MEECEERLEDDEIDNLLAELNIAPKSLAENKESETNESIDEDLEEILNK